MPNQYDNTTVNSFMYALALRAAQELSKIMEDLALLPCWLPHEIESLKNGGAKKTDTTTLGGMKSLVFRCRLWVIRCMYICGPTFLVLAIWMIQTGEGLNSLSDYLIYANYFKRSNYWHPIPKCIKVHFNWPSLLGSIISSKFLFDWIYWLGEYNTFV